MYSKYIPRAPYTEGKIEGENLHRTIQAMGRTVPGLNGSRIDEVKLLGKGAWNQRATIVEVQMKVGKVPASYKQVSTPMMPKSKGTEITMDHRGLAIYFILWRAESGAWYQKLSRWQEEVAAAGH